MGYCGGVEVSCPPVYAATEPTDVIVVGTHGRGTVAHFFMGSVAERVVRTAPCPVLTVHAAEHDFLVFEDTEAGVASAKAAGMRCFGVLGTLSPERLAQADEIVERIDLALMRRLFGEA